MGVSFRRVLGVAKSNQASPNIDQKVDRTAMTGVFNLGDIFAEVVEGLNDPAFV